MTAPKTFNICVIRPEGYAHHQAFDEIADLLAHAITELGHPCGITSNEWSAERTDIVIGCHLLRSTADLPDSAILLNTEQLFSRQNADWTERVLGYARKHRLWDYNEKNIAALAARGIDGARLLRIGYQKELQRIAPAAEQDIDVLFYGSYNDRRSAVLKALRQRGLNVSTLFGVYGAERDAHIARSKVVLNMHYYDQHIFEVVRVFYLMSNRKAVVAEVSADTTVEWRFLKGLSTVPYDGLVEACVALVADAAERQRLEAEALNTISAWPQSRFLQPLLTDD